MLKFVSMGLKKLKNEFLLCWYNIFTYLYSLVFRFFKGPFMHHQIFTHQRFKGLSQLVAAVRPRFELPCIVCLVINKDKRNQM